MDIPDSSASATSSSPATSRYEQSFGVNQYGYQFNCNICMHPSRDPVVIRCGHLFCWPCLYYQLSLHSASQECPVCQADVKKRIVPLYGCGIMSGFSDEEKQKFCGMDIPCRPSATRSISSNSGGSEANLAGHSHEMHDHISARSGICVSILRFVLASLPPENSGFLRRKLYGAVSLLLHRRRYSNEKEFVLHWVFIVMGLIAIAIFLAS